MTQPANEEDQSIQTLLNRVSTITMVLGFAIRVLTPGWVLIFFFLPLLIIMSLQNSIVRGSIQKIPYTKSPYEYLIFFSTLFFFLGCVFQVDIDDAAAYVPILLPLLTKISISQGSSWLHTFSVISNGSFIAMFLTWILLLTLSRNVLKK